MTWRDKSILSLDLTGAALGLALILVSGWYGFFRPSSALVELSRVRAELDLRRRDLTTLQRELDGFQAVVREREAELSSAGTPPVRSPIEEDLRTVSELMRRHGLEVAEVSPMATTAYPGVLESRYRLRASGGCLEIGRALADFEGCRFWGDITDLQIGELEGPKGAESRSRRVDLTVSFYSASESPAAAGARGT